MEKKLLKLAQRSRAFKCAILGYFVVDVWLITRVPWENDRVSVEGRLI